MTKLDRYRDYIEAHPGCSSFDLAEAFDVPVKTVRRTLQIDITRKHIDSDVVGNVCHYWLQSRPRRKIEELEARILAALKGRRAVKVADIASDIGESYRYTHVHLTRMERAGKVKSTLFGYPIRWYVAQGPAR